jgi:hypothetical protein
MLMFAPSPSSKFCTSTTVDHVESQRSSAWCMPVCDSAVDSAALHRRPSQAAYGRRAHAPGVFYAILGVLSTCTPKSR